MEFLVYYRAWPHKNLRVVAAEAESSSDAIAEVAAMLNEEKEQYFNPLIAMIVGGKA